MKTRKLFFTALIICLFATFAVAQIEEENWQTYSPVDEEFSVDAPSSIKGGSYSINPTKNIYSGNHRAFSKGNYYFILSENLLTSEKPKKNSYEFASEKFDDYVRPYRVAKNEVTVNNCKGKKYVFADDEGFYQQILIIAVKNRSYIFRTISENEDDSAINKFFSSLKFFENEKLTNFTYIPPVSGKVIYPESKIQGSGSGGRGDNPKVPAPILPSTQINSTRNIFKILLQPRASYKDEARIYQISGVVQLRVTFLANGSIGAIKIIKRLPLGLTNSAIEAAKGVQFDPAPGNISKTLEYRFTLY
jgi:TonB family protein